MATMTLTLPIPGIITKKNAEFQTQRMLAVSAGLLLHEPAEFASDRLKNRQHH
jgi:hypothetical protein